MDLSVVIPCYNEEKKLLNSLGTIHKYLLDNNYSFEMLVVNDGSKDGTKEIIENFMQTKENIRLINLEKNMGKGFAVKTGILNAKKDFILFMDADLSTPIEELGSFKEQSPNYNILIGSRKVKGANITSFQPWHRKLAGEIFPLVVQVLGVSKMRDTQCGFKMFKREVGQRLVSKQTIDRWGFDAELMYLAKKYKYRVKELPVSWENSVDSKLNTIKDGFGMFRELVKIKINDFKGKYK
jgi:dolichyl-phosphate beta-glucosyltransferase